MKPPSETMWGVKGDPADGGQTSPRLWKRPAPFGRADPLDDQSPPTAPPAAFQEDAQAIVSDALAQAALIRQQAESAAEEIVADAREEADRRLGDAQTSARVLREQADAVIAAARHGSQEHRDKAAAEIEQAMAQHEAALRHKSAEHDARLEEEAAAAAAHSEALTDEARATADTIVAEAKQHAEDVRLEAETNRANAKDEAVMLLETARKNAGKELDAARSHAARELASAAEQTAWTQQTLENLRTAASGDAQRTRDEAALEAEAIIHQARTRTLEIVAASRERLRARMRESELRRQAHEELGAEALATAQRDAEIIRTQSREDAEILLGRAEDEANQRAAIAKRRVAEAEASATQIREQIAADMERTQRESREMRRSARAEAAALLQDARTEADELRYGARALLSEARGEVAALTAQRDAIAKELGDLSGVIEALAVPSRSEPAAVKQSESHTER